MAGKQQRISFEEFADIWLSVHKTDPVSGFGEVAKRAKLSHKQCSYMASQCRTNGAILPYFGQQKTDWSRLAERIESKTGEVTPRVRSTPAKSKDKAKAKAKASAKTKTKRVAKKKVAKRASAAKTNGAAKANGASKPSTTTAAAAAS